MADLSTLKPRFTRKRASLLVRMAWRNIWRSPVRSGITLVAMTFGLAVVVVYLSFVKGMLLEMRNAVTESTVGHLQIHRQAYLNDQDLYGTLPEELQARLEEALGGSVAISSRRYAGGLVSAGDFSYGAMIRALDPNQEKQVTTFTDRLQEGHMDLGQEPNPETGYPMYHVVLGKNLAKNLSVELGDELVLVTQAVDGSIGNGLFRVVGVLKAVDPAFDRAGVLMSAEAYGALMYFDAGPHELVLKLAEGPMEANVQRDKVKALLEEWGYTANNGDEIVVRSWMDIMPEMADMLTIGDSAFLIVSVIVYILAGLGLLNTVLMSVFERRKEFGTLLSLGFPSFSLMSMVMLESLLLSLVSVITGGGLGTLWSLDLQANGWNWASEMPDGFDWGGVNFAPVFYAQFDPKFVMQAGLLLVVTVLIATLYPAWKTVRIKPVELQ